MRKVMSKMYIRVKLKELDLSIPDEIPTLHFRYLNGIMPRIYATQIALHILYKLMIIKNGLDFEAHLKN